MTDAPSHFMRALAALPRDCIRIGAPPFVKRHPNARTITGSDCGPEYSIVMWGYENPDGVRVIEGLAEFRAQPEAPE